MSSQYTINLLKPELLPSKVLFTLKNVVISWGVVLTVMIFWSVFTQLSLNSLEADFNVLNKEKSAQTALLAKLEIKLSQQKADPILVSKLATLKQLMINKKSLIAHLTNDTETYITGFAKAMTELSELHSADISLQQVIINQHAMTFAGMARTPEAVPKWLAKFEHSSVLSGKAFNNFSLQENENKFTDFIVSSSTEEVNK